MRVIHQGLHFGKSPGSNAEELFPRFLDKKAQILVGPWVAICS